MTDDPANWPSDYAAYEFFGRAMDRLAKVAAVDGVVEATVWQALQRGILKAGIIKRGVTDDREPGPLAAIAFLQVDRTQLFETGCCDVLDRHEGTPLWLCRKIPVPHWLFVTRESWQSFLKTLPSVSTAQQARATDRLASVFEKQPGLSRAEAQNEIAQFRLGPRAFQRVWQNARKGAHLPERARAGAKKKS